MGGNSYNEQFAYNGNHEPVLPSPSRMEPSYNEQFAYNGNHDIITFTDKPGHTSWTAVYDPFDDSLSQITDANSNTTIYQYASGQTTISDPNVHSIKHVYSSNRLSSVVDQRNTLESYIYDSNNNKTQVTDRRGHN